MRQCPRCGGIMTAQAVSILKPRGCLTVLFYIILLCIPVLGWIAIFFLIRGRRSKLRTYFVCGSCGYTRR